MANTLQGGTALVFSTSDTTYGLVQSHTITANTERAEARGAGGHVASIQEYNDTSGLSLSYLELASATGKPGIGATFTFLGETWYINSIASAQTVDGFKTVDVDATNYPNLGA